MPVVDGKSERIKQLKLCSLSLKYCPQFLVVHKTLNLLSMRIFVLHIKKPPIFIHKVLSLKSFCFSVVVMTSSSHMIAALQERRHRRIKGEMVGRLFRPNRGWTKWDGVA